MHTSHMPGIRRLCIALCAGLIPTVYGQAPAADEPLEEVVVTGEFPARACGK